MTDVYSTGYFSIRRIKGTIFHEARDWIVGLALLCFGIKAGVISLHVWLPLAHPVAPIPARAVLSGAMIAAGLLGWLCVLPLGETALSGWGGAMISALWPVALAGRQVLMDFLAVYDSSGRSSAYREYRLCSFVVSDRSFGFEIDQSHGPFLITVKTDLDTG